MAHFCENVPIVLVCTKIDLREDPTTVSLMAAQGTKPITHAEGSRIANEIKASRYLECSAKTGYNVGNVFEGALRDAMRKRGFGLKKGKGKNCVVL
jgi:Rho family protein